MANSKSHGGKRLGAGRLNLFETELCGWVVDAVRLELRAEKQRYNIAALEKTNDAWVEVHELQNVLSRERIEHRQVKYVAGLGETPNGPEKGNYVAREPRVQEALEDISWHFQSEEGGPGLPRLLYSVELPAKRVGKVYASVADAASVHFKTKITSRQVKRCIERWRDYERWILEPNSPKTP